MLIVFLILIAGVIYAVSEYRKDSAQSDAAREYLRQTGQRKRHGWNKTR